MFISQVLPQIRMQMQKFEKPLEEKSFWGKILSKKELQKLADGAHQHDQDPEKMGFVLGSLLEKRLEKDISISKEFLQVLTDFISISGFLSPIYQQALHSRNTLAKLAALKDCLEAGKQSNYFYFMSSLLKEDFIKYAAQKGIAGPSFATSREDLAHRISSYEKNLLASNPPETAIPGVTETEFKNNIFLIRTILEKKIIAEARFEFASSQTIRAIHMSVLPEYRRSGISRYFGAIVLQRFPRLKRVEAFLGLKNFEIFSEELQRSREDQTDLKIRQAILNSPAGRIATALGYGNLDAYEVRKRDVRIVLTRMARTGPCSDLL